MSKVSPWNAAPLYKVAIVFALGICCSGLSMLWISLIALSIFSLSFRSIRLIRQPFLYALVFLLGLANTQLCQIERPDLPEIFTEDVVLLRIDSAPIFRKGKQKVEALVLDSQSSELIQSSIQLQADSTFQLTMGDVLICSGKWFPFYAPGLPEDFDYPSYMKSKGIHCSFRLSEIYDRQAPDVTYLHRFRRAQQVLVGRIKASESVHGLLAALITGWKADLSPEIKQGFGTSGVMHILAVSGLHVGLIMWILGRITTVLKQKLVLRLLRFVIIIVGIWTYALMTGASPSVLRAAIMCSFLALSMLNTRKSNGLNLLGASALLLLWFEPGLLMNSGFQLSYLAVTGLILYQPQQPLKKVNRIRAYLSSALRTSLVAQIWTSPLAVRLFGIFPSYFLFGNLLILPLAILLLYTGILGIIFYDFTLISNGFQVLNEFLASLMLYISEKISQLPGARLEVTPAPSLWVFLFIGILLLWRERHHLGNRYCFMLTVGMVVIVGLIPNELYRTSESIIIGRRESSMVVRTNSEERSFLFADERIAENEPDLDYFESHGRTFIIVNNLPRGILRSTFKCDIILLNGPSPRKEYWDVLKDKLQPRQIILHHQYSYSKRRKWEEMIESETDSTMIHSLSDGWIALQ